jgi:hypothetical protein
VLRRLPPCHHCHLQPYSLGHAQEVSEVEGVHAVVEESRGGAFADVAREHVAPYVVNQGVEELGLKAQGGGFLGGKEGIPGVAEGTDGAGLVAFAG